MSIPSVSPTNYDDFYKQISAPQKSQIQKAENKAIEAEMPAATQTQKLTLGQKFDAAVDKFSTEIKNSADLNDTVTVPRTIFKGYLAFFAGTTLLGLGGILSKPKFIKNILNASSALTCLAGTYFFVRPYLIKNNKN